MFKVFRMDGPIVCKFMCGEQRNIETNLKLLEDEFQGIICIAGLLSWKKIRGPLEDFLELISTETTI